MQFLEDTAHLKARATAAVFVLGLLIALAVVVTAKAGSTSAATGQPNIGGVWSGKLVERDADGNPKSHSTLYLRLDQSSNAIKGVIGENEASASPIDGVVLTGNHLRFTAHAAGGPKGPVTWVLDLDVAAQGDEMTGHGHAFRKADNHSWDAEARFSRQQ